ncbi:MAG TPA: cyclopropane-fatty-acyl-phospholipid synthase family protein [Aggregatilineaceae bacterium]|nr:cyclopropane-fatty-acyl-phospholipid synthase family protein [Aggregatilineaceae bacterium]
MSQSSSDGVLVRTTSILDRLFPPPRRFTVRLWDGTELPGSSDSGFCLVFNHSGALRRMLTPPVELSLGEAFIYGDIDIDGDIFAATSLVDDLLGQRFSAGDMVALARGLRALPRAGSEHVAGRGAARLRGSRHSPARDRAAIQYHYDVGNNFYALWLDRNMQYSCAYFHTGTEDLDTAQEQKLEHICRKLRLRPGERLLDIGCGWGGLILHAAARCGVQALGITLSQNQVEYANDQIARASLGDRVQVKLMDYRDPHLGQFDKIVSVGMFEHVGCSHLPGYFAQAYWLLKPGGLFLNHGISLRSPLRYAASTDSSNGTPVRMRRGAIWNKLIERYVLGAGSFIQRYVFPDGEVIPVSEINLVAEQAGFEVRDVENLREHYALTLRQWVRRLEAHQEQAIRAADEATYRVWRLYMAAVTYGFETGMNNVNQTLLSRPNAGKSNLPLTRTDLYDGAGG